LLLACAVIEETVRLQQKLWKQSGSDSMVRSHKRLLALLGMLLVLVLLTTVLYMAGMSYLEGKPRGFWDALEWAGESLSTTGYGRDSSWSIRSWCPTSSSCNLSAYFWFSWSFQST
jgi:hypothetical protein